MPGPDAALPHRLRDHAAVVARRDLDATRWLKGRFAESFSPRRLVFWDLMMSFGVCGSDNLAGFTVYRSNLVLGVAQFSPGGVSICWQRAQTADKISREPNFPQPEHTPFKSKSFEDASIRKELFLRIGGLGLASNTGVIAYLRESTSRDERVASGGGRVRGRNLERCSDLRKQQLEVQRYF